MNTVYAVSSAPAMHVRLSAMRQLGLSVVSGSPLIRPVEEFLTYVQEPPQIRIVQEHMKSELLQLPRVKANDPAIMTLHASYVAPTLDSFVATQEREHSTPRSRLPRNVPCPCGSGRKYKHCCGAPTGR